MRLSRQLQEACIYAPRASIAHSRRSFKALLIYVGAAAIVFALVTWAISANQELLQQTLLDYIFPQQWHGITEYAIGYFFETQSKIVLAGFITSSSLVAASLLLFPLKEHCSAIFEREKYPLNGQPNEFPLIRQGLEETKLFLLYLTAQLIILAIGYYPFVIAKIASTILSLLFLFYTFGLDFISPTLQRHKIPYTHILKVLVKNAPLTFMFGALFSAPALFTTQALLSWTSLSIGSLIAAVLFVNLIFLSLAINAGTRIASSLLTEAQTTPEPSIKSRTWLYSSTVGLLFLGLVFHGKLLLSLHHKSQILKCEYDIDWASLDVDLPSLSDLRGGKGISDVKFDLSIRNTTPFDVHLEPSTFTLLQNGKSVSTTALTEIFVPAGATRKQHLHWQTTITPKSLSNFTRLHKGWSAQIQYDIWPGLPFIIHLGELQ